MKRTLLSLFMATLATCTLHAQSSANGSASQTGASQKAPEAEVIYANDFSKNADGWNIVNTTIPQELNYVWKHNPKFGNWNASAYLSKTKKKYAAEAWIISPEITLTKAAVLSFDHYQRFFTDLSSEQTLWIRVKGEAWKQLAIPNTTPAADATNTTNNNFIASGDIALGNEFVGKTVEIGFKYVSTETSASTWRIKNLKVQAAPTAINAVSTDNTATAIYDLNGRRVQKAEKGIYIINGKKVMK